MSAVIPLAPTARSPLHQEILKGLDAPQKRLPAKLFYDARGSELFDDICRLPEYYVTRTELAIMREHIDGICAALAPCTRLVELGSGSSVKTRLLLDRLPAGLRYLPVEVSREHLLKTAAGLRQAYPALAVQPLAADFTAALPPAESQATAVYFPGSTLGNFEPRQARALLRRIRALAGRGGGLLLGVDLRKDPAVLHAAYNDSAGVTAAFNLNLLARLNREFGADFDLAAFRHQAHYDAWRGRIEMHLVSGRPQSFGVLGRRFRLRRGETLHTENSHKHSFAGLARLARSTGFRVAQSWTDPQSYFAVQWWQARI